MNPPLETTLQSIAASDSGSLPDLTYLVRSFLQFELMLEQRLRAIKGKFLLSLDDRSEVRQLFANFRFTSVELAYTAKRDTAMRHKEVLISNYDP